MFLWLVLGVLAAPDTAGNLFSPGPLSAAHQSLNGTFQCGACHAERGHITAAKCLACHRAIETRIDTHRGYHGQRELRDKRCSDCHKEHGGEDKSLAPWESQPNTFAHSLTGYALKGEHRKVPCRACHKASAVADEDIKAFLKKNPQRRTWLGMPTECNTCHNNEHRNERFKDCTRCHTEKSWVEVGAFDHDKADFALTGAHRDIPCQSCHLLHADKRGVYTVFAPMLHDTCVRCHKDAHKGKLGPNCVACHNTNDWQKVNDADTDRSFHNATRFPLTGRHANVTCDGCHRTTKNSVFCIGSRNKLESFSFLWRLRFVAGGWPLQFRWP